VLNKVDIADKPRLLQLAERLQAIASFAETWFVSAETGDGVPELKQAMAGAMPEGPWHYPEDQVSDASERALAAEITREHIFRRLHAELPYASTVETEAFTERPDGSVEIRQVVLVERPTQRAIMLGKGGQQIKAIGAAARTELAALWNRPVHLYLHVKTKPGWDEDREIYRDLGLDWVE
jgi:GTP-binding protein Era